MECCNCLQPWLHDGSSFLSSKGRNPNLVYSESRHVCCSEFFSIFPQFCVWMQTAAPSLDSLICGDLSSVNHLCSVCKLQIISVPLSVKVLILRCQHFGLDWLLKTILVCFAKKPSADERSVLHFHLLCACQVTSFVWQMLQHGSRTSRTSFLLTDPVLYVNLQPLCLASHNSFTC